MSNQKEKAVEEQVIYDLQVEAIRVKGERDGKAYDFLTFETFEKKSGKKARIKFTKDCVGVPEEEGTYLMKVDKKNINKDKQSKYNIYWVRELISCDDYMATFENDDDLDF